MRLCHVCGFQRNRSSFTMRPLPDGTRLTLCRQCAETSDMRQAAAREQAAWSFAHQEIRP